MRKSMAFLLSLATSAHAQTLPRDLFGAFTAPLLTTRFRAR